MAINHNLYGGIKNIQLINVADECAVYDPDLPNANAVMAAICCVSVRYAAQPSMELALLACDLSHQLMADEYAESQLVVDIAKHLCRNWDAVVDKLNDALLTEAAKKTQH